MWVCGHTDVSSATAGFLISEKHQASWNDQKNVPDEDPLKHSGYMPPVSPCGWHGRHNKANVIELAVENHSHFWMKNNFQERKYNGIEEMKRIYMKLSEFLNESSFIGKEFVRTIPIRMNGMLDTSYTSPLKEKNIVIYAKNDLFLAVKRKIEQDKLIERYTLINSNYIKDRNYEFYGNIYPEYKDKNKVYKLIRRQLEKEKI